MGDFAWLLTPRVDTIINIMVKTTREWNQLGRASVLKFLYQVVFSFIDLLNTICDWICEKGSYTRIQFFNFKEI